MTLSTTVSRVSYDGDASTSAFSFPYKYVSSADLVVVLVDEDDGSETVQTITTHYTVAATGAAANGVYPGATVTMVLTPGTDKKVVIYRRPAFTQEFDFEGETDALAALNRFADYIMMRLQRLENDGVKLPKGTLSGFEQHLPGLMGEAGNVVAINDDEDGFEYVAFEAVSAGLKYAWDTGTSDADPGTGEIRANHATLASATQLYISETDGDGGTVSAILQAFDDSTSTVKGYLTLREASAPENFVTFSVSGSVTDAGSYDKVTVTYVAGNGGFAAADTVYLIFERTGDAGATGSTGASGSNGASIGVVQAYSTTTTDSDPGAGIFRFNNATIASVTAAYLDNVDANAVTVSGYIDTFDDSTSTLRGYLVFRGITTGSAFAVFSVSGSVTDGTGYRKLTLTHIASGGTWTNGESFAWSFHRNGDKGDTGATGPAGAGSGDVLGPATHADSTVPLWNGANSKTLKDATAAQGRTALGLVIGTDVQAYDAQLADVAGLTPTDNGVIIGNGSNFVVESGATLKTSLGLTIGTDVQAQDSDLAAVAALTTTAAGRSILAYTDPNADQIGFWDDSAGAWASFTSVPPELSISGTTLLLTHTLWIKCSDETTEITTGTNKATYVFPFNVTVVAVGASLNTVSSSGNPTIDINEGGTTILSTKLTIDAGEKTSLTAATPAVISDSAIAAGAEVGIDIDVAGTGAKGLVVWIQYRRTS